MKLQDRRDTTQTQPNTGRRPAFIQPVKPVSIFSRPALGTENSTPAAETDMSAFQAYFHDRFPNVKIADFTNGPYAADANMRKQ